MVVVALAMAGCGGPDEVDRGCAPPRLLWLIPDGLRADPDLFTVFRWAQDGQLPNLARMMEQGAWGYSVPDFPSHTPTNFATLLTGAHPVVHGVADGPMHTEGQPLTRPAIGGFSSAAKRVPPVWRTLEDEGMTVALVSVPGSTPPELRRGVVVRGRWGGWGADTPAVVFEPTELLPRRREAGKAFRLFFLGQRLTEFVDVTTGDGWSDAPSSSKPARVATLSAYGLDVRALVADVEEDEAGYDRVAFSLDGRRTAWSLAEGQTSPWTPVRLVWREQAFPCQVRARVIKLWPDTGSFRIRLVFGGANRFNTLPPKVAELLEGEAGPMVDFVDNWPQQLVYETEDRAAFLDEMRDSLDWHRRAAGVILDRVRPDVLIQDTYTPNQMLESRWWMREVDPNHPEHDPATATTAWDDLLEMYRRIDAILGEMLDRRGPTTVVALSSDHGILPLYRQVRLNNLFARRGWLRFTIDETSGEPTIDWAATRVVYLKMAHVYVHPDGLEGPWHRASGEAYHALRNEVVGAIAALEDADLGRPLVRAVRWEDVEREMLLPADRVGDLVLEVAPGFTWWEEVTEDRRIFTTPATSGYKQAVDAVGNPGMWTPFAVVGPGVRPGSSLPEPISHVDQLPTLLELINVPVPDHVQGRVLREILNDG